MSTLFRARREAARLCLRDLKPRSRTFDTITILRSTQAGSQVHDKTRKDEANPPT